MPARNSRPDDDVRMDQFSALEPSAELAQRRPALGRGLTSAQSRLSVFTNASAMPLDGELRTGVAHGFSPTRWPAARVSRAT